MTSTTEPSDQRIEPAATEAPGATASAIPGPRLPGLLQTWLGVLRPIETRLAARRRYGPVFRSSDVLAGELIHIADRNLIEQMFKWKPHE